MVMFYPFFRIKMNLRIRERSFSLCYMVVLSVKNLPARQETRVQSLGQEATLEKKMATHSRILAREVPRTEEPDRLQSMGRKNRT